MKRRYFKHTESGEIYFIGKNQRRCDNLINMRSGSEYFIPGYMWEEWEQRSHNFDQITKDRALKEIPEPYGVHL